MGIKGSRMMTPEGSTYPLSARVPLKGQMGEHRVNGLAPDATEVKPMAPEETLPSTKRVDSRAWESCSKYGSRLQCQVGSERGSGDVKTFKYKSRVPDPDNAGSERTKTFRARNLTDARRLHVERLDAVPKGEEAAPAQKTVDELAEEVWTRMEGMIASGERAPGTLERYKIQYRVHIQPTMGNRKVQVAFRPESISRWLAEKRTQGLEVGSIYSILSILISRALKSGLLPEDPRKRLDDGEIPQSVPKKDKRWLTDEECSKLIENALPSTRNVVAFMAFTGVRQSEALGVTWGDLDLEDGSAKISRQLKRRKRNEADQRVPLKTARRKNGCREREIELLPDLVSLLKRLKAESFEAGHARPEDFVFSTDEGRALLHRNVSRDFDLAADRAGLNREGLPKVTCHSLRRTAISRWIAAGDDAQTIAREAGDNIETIMGSYAGDFEKAKRRQDRLERLQAGTSISLA